MSHSADTAITCVLDHLLVALDSRKVAFLCLPYYSAAFDLVLHSTLFSFLFSISIKAAHLIGSSLVLQDLVCCHLWQRIIHQNSVLWHPSGINSWPNAFHDLHPPHYRLTTFHPYRITLNSRACLNKHAPLYFVSCWHHLSSVPLPSQIDRFKMLRWQECVCSGVIRTCGGWGLIDWLYHACRCLQFPLALNIHILSA